MSVKLSVIVPAYNLEDYIVECLLSVLDQDVAFTYEVIVCDDCSSDKTAEKIRTLQRQYPNLLKPVYKPENQGLAKNMQTLLSLCLGEYIAYLDGDDVALPGKLQRQVDYLDAHPDCQMVFHESDMFDSDTDQSIKLYSQQYYNWEHIPQRSQIEHLVKFGTYMQASSVMFRRHQNLVETVAEDCQIIFDYPFYILNAGYLNANIDFIPEVLGRYRIHQASFGAQTSRSATRREQSLIDIQLACEKSRSFGVDEKVIAQGIAHHQFAAALYFLSREQEQLFRQYIEKSSAQNWFFNAKHRLAFDLRDDIDTLKRRLKDVA